MRPVALIPAYKPSASLIEIVRDLNTSGVFHAIVCVDDGSGAGYWHVFDNLGSLGVTVLRHATNLGKGNALKTGINHVAVQYPEAAGVVTLDADGQHLAKDCISVAKAFGLNGRHLVLGVRTFAATSVPFRSKFGNAVTRLVTRFFSGVDVADTQTGLRGIPSFLFPSLLKLKSGGYDFELDMLMTACEQGVPLLQVPIETVYLDNNTSSSFNPFWDSVKIYMVFLRFNLSALITFAIDYLVFGLIFALSSSVGLSIALARLCAGAFNYKVNKEIVFRSTRRHVEALLLYGLTAC
jgi:glycosyltransferase involved in cell wall biosynthesis